jgi:5-methylcytosine-specific restriction endonuclease McrA
MYERILKECEQCGADYWTYNRKAKKCNDCLNEKMYQKQLHKHICPICGIEFSAGIKKKYCSKGCSRGIRHTDMGLMTKLTKEYFCEKFYFTCQKCLAIGTMENFHIHHIIPLSDRGKNTEDNLTLLCIICHRKAHGMVKE